MLFNAGSHSVSSSLAMLLLRLTAGGSMLTHGIPKLLHFSEKAPHFDPIGLGGPLSLGLVVFAEVLCSILLILGIGSRFVTIPLMITMLVAIFVVHWNDPFGKKELALLYLVMYLAIFIAGAGSFSMDAGMSGKKK